eukprot:11861485-Ditylum_brightwellii.AAC.1
MDKHVWTGIFLEYTATMQQIYYYDVILDCVKTASYVKFDEGMNDLAFPSPHVRQLQQTLGYNFPAEDITDDAPRELCNEAQLLPLVE